MARKQRKSHRAVEKTVQLARDLRTTDEERSLNPPGRMLSKLTRASDRIVTEMTEQIEADPNLSMELRSTGVLRLAWRVVRVALVVSLCTLLALLAWSADFFVLQLIALVLGGCGAVFTGLFLTALVREDENLKVFISLSVLGMFVVLFGLVGISREYLILNGERVSASIGAPECETDVGWRPDGDEYGCLDKYYPVRHPDGHLLDRWSSYPDEELVNDGRIAVYWDPSGIAPPAEAAEIEGTRKHWYTWTWLAFLFGPTLISAVYGEIKVRPARRGGRGPRERAKT
ncbi:hypothetical protein ACODT5_06760 [Streptomyces sp. 5.8]|uniref:hypothetical protein n=1 Tax=Streptomyces sp. 5.8 TaxID=3406571 RepID=UPI003BB5BF4D